MSFNKAWNSTIFGAFFKILILNLFVVLILFLILTFKYTV